MPIYKTDKKQNGIYLYRVVVNYTDIAGNYRKKEKSVYGYAEAKEAVAAPAAQLNICAGDRLTVNTLFYKYIDVKKAQIRKSSLDKVAQHLTGYVIPLLGSYKLNKLTSSVMQKRKFEIHEKRYFQQFDG